MARKKRAAPHEEHEGEPWLLPYSDLMTLLLALFIALFAMSQSDTDKMKEMAQAFSAAFNMGGPSFFEQMGPNPGRQAEIISDDDAGNSAYLQEAKHLEHVQKQMEEYIKENNMSDEISTLMTEEGLMIRIKEQALFPSGSATLVAESQRIAPVIAGLLATLPERVIVSGHTDTVPINTAEFPSNWDLSSKRALNFMRYIVASDDRLNPARFSAIGYGEYRPIGDNNTDAGRQSNRRVEILIARNYQFNADISTGGASTSYPIVVPTVSPGGGAGGGMVDIGDLPDEGMTLDAAAETVGVSSGENTTSL
ncbi:flagellar motor protein MotB [Selenomonas sp. TAMA-11512]|uniref:flagellar motor protein MotB n=1 Tax=Selenomonas sp. TAMA-11512 TaxID=3095337 RepID=UPI00308F830A|nr:flagellar motor protein MotB [Selenomonas sp. TAMA-11512]